MCDPAHAHFFSPRSVMSVTQVIVV
uniref:Uncharacterized protein n=1 Tax=Anguilla anguilla TaxID=7936 RepID=A0A0E9SR19_ANGAN